MGQVIAVMDVGGTSIKTGAVRFDDDRSDPRIEVGPSLPTNANEPADVVLDSLAAGADAALDVAGREVAGLAIAICGPFDIDAGISRMRGVHKFEDIYGIDLRAALRERSTVSGLPIRFSRDAESAGTGESIAGAGAGVDRVLTMTVGTGLGTCLTERARPIEFVDGFGVEHLAMRDTPWGGRADDVLSAHGLADRLGVPMADLRTAVDDPANADVVSDHGTRLGTFLSAEDSPEPSTGSARRCRPPSAPSPSAPPHSAPPAPCSAPPTSPSAPDATPSNAPSDERSDRIRRFRSSRDPTAPTR